MSSITKPLPLCFYHKNCLDGIAAAWVVWRFFKGAVELRSMQYGDVMPEASVISGRDVYLVDFSWPREVVLEAMKICTLTILDHHETASKALAGIVKVDQSRSGAVLAWHYFFPGEQVPAELLLVEDYDLWKWKLKDTKLWNMAAMSYPYTVENFDSLLTRGVESVCCEGSHLLRQHEINVQKFARAAREMVINGVTVPVVNANACFTNDLGALLSQDAPFAAIYSDGRDKRIFSLRSNGRVEVNTIAEMFGGGGHRQAAAFSISYDSPLFPMSHKYLNSHEVGHE